MSDDQPLDLLRAEDYKGDLACVHLNNGDGYPACGSRTTSLNYDPLKQLEFPDSGCMRCRKILVSRGRAAVLPPPLRRLHLSQRRL